ncbi:MAG: hypothetical protein H0V93_14000 [Euzebyales bacterium]|nr:hypothetical protein [Euzebyales bacterium]
MTVPCAARIDPDATEDDRWRSAPVGLRELLAAAAPGGALAVRGLGNLPATVAFLEGIAAEELPADLLDVHDEAFPLLAAAVAVKPGVEALR